MSEGRVVFCCMESLSSLPAIPSSLLVVLKGEEDVLIEKCVKAVEGVGETDGIEERGAWRKMHVTGESVVGFALAEAGHLLAPFVGSEGDGEGSTEVGV